VAPLVKAVQLSGPLLGITIQGIESLLLEAVAHKLWDLALERQEAELKTAVWLCNDGFREYHKGGDCERHERQRNGTSRRCTPAL
jgi:hypothetical protein